MMRRASRTTIVAAVLGLALIGATPALSAQDPVIADCSANQQLTATYTLQQLQHALRTMSPTTKEYSNCYDVITRALQLKNGTGGNNGTSNSSGGSFLPVWLIIVLVVLIVGAGAYGVLAYRNRGGPGADAGAES
jgi:hypothetical protein